MSINGCTSALSSSRDGGIKKNSYAIHTLFFTPNPYTVYTVPRIYTVNSVFFKIKNHNYEHLMIHLTGIIEFI